MKYEDIQNGLYYLSVQNQQCINNDNTRRGNVWLLFLKNTSLLHGKYIFSTIFLLFYGIFRTALKVENIIRETGALPATIGVIEGKLIVGMLPFSACVLCYYVYTLSRIPNYLLQQNNETIQESCYHFS